MTTTTNSKSKTELKPLTWLVEDWGLYPRGQVDNSNVRDLADALQAGEELPPMVVEESTGRIIDGFHRRRAYIRVFGADHKVPVTLRTYEEEGKAFADAVRLNRSHGRKLNSSDLIKSLHRLREMGVDEEEIMTVLRIPKARVDKLTFRVAVDEADEPVPLKGGDAHLQGRILDSEQIETLTHRLGVSYGRLAVQIRDGCKNDLLPDDESFWVVLREMHEAVGEALARHDAE